MTLFQCGISPKRTNDGPRQHKGRRFICDKSLVQVREAVDESQGNADFTLFANRLISYVYWKFKT